MDWQLIIVGLLVAGAAAYLARTWFGKGKAGCGGGCACPVKPPLDEPADGRRLIIPADQIRLLEKR